MRLRGIQVVIERGPHGRNGILGKLSHRLVRAFREVASREAQAEIAQAIHRSRRLVQPVPGEIELVAVRHGRKQVPNRRRLVPLQHEIPRREEIPQTLRHLLAFHEQKASMEPEVRESFPGQRLRLRNFIFVMRKDQVFAASVQVKGVAQLLHRHDRAFNVPSRTPASNGRLPKCLARLGRFPERKIPGIVFLVFIQINARPIFHARKIFLRELAVSRELRDGKVVGAVFAAVRKAFLLEFADEVRHRRDVIGGAHQHRLLNIQHGRVFEERLFVFRRVLPDADTSARGVADDLVVHVRDVHDVAHLVAALLQEALKNIDRDKCSEVADVAVVVHGGPAGVHANLVGLDRAKLLHPRGHGVIEAQCHRKDQGVRDEPFILGGGEKGGQ